MPELGIELEEVVEKMSKSRGNVVNPDDVIAEHGADAMRLYEMFIGPLNRAAPWSTEGIPGVVRFLHRCHRLVMDDDDGGSRPRALEDGPGSDAQQRLCAQTIQGVTEDYEGLEFNTAISKLMVFVRDVEKEQLIPRGMADVFVRLLAPLAPHLGEELWQALGHEGSVAYASWPEADAAALVEDEIEIGVQVKGKMRARIKIPADATEDQAREIALQEPNVQKFLGDQAPKRVIYVPGRMLNIVV